MNNNREKQLEDANVVIMGLTDKYMPKHTAYEWALDYRKKYFPPKKTIYEKLSEYIDWLFGYAESDDKWEKEKCFEEFKEIFKDDINPTIALVEIQSYFSNYKDGSVFPINEIRLLIANVIQKHSTEKDEN